MQSCVAPWAWLPRRGLRAVAGGSRRVGADRSPLPSWQLYWHGRQGLAHGSNVEAQRMAAVGSPPRRGDHEIMVVEGAPTWSCALTSGPQLGPPEPGRRGIPDKADPAKGQTVPPPPEAERDVGSKAAQTRRSHWRPDRASL